MRVLLIALLGLSSLTGCQKEESQEGSTEETVVENSVVEDSTPDELASVDASGLSGESAIQKKAQDLIDKNSETHTGMIVYKPFEGGFYAFENNQGARFTLMGLKPEHQVDGLKVRIQGMPMPDVMTTTQFGIPFKLSDITVLDDGKVTPRNDI